MDKDIYWEGCIDYNTDLGVTEYFCTQEENFFKVLEEISIKYNDLNINGIEIWKVCGKE